MLEVAEGVQYLHSGGIVHGDLHGVSKLELIPPIQSIQVITLFYSGISSLILNSTAKLLILEQLTMLNPPL